MKNEYRIEDDKVFIALSQGEEFVIDKSDLKLVARFNWYLMQDKYVYNRLAGSIHTYICGVPSLAGDKIPCGYIDGDRFNNCRENLWISINPNKEKKKKKKKSSEYRGVYWHNHARKWAVGFQGETIGYYDDEKQAGRVRNYVARERFGKHARLTTIDGKIEFEKPKTLDFSSKLPGVSWSKQMKRYKAQYRGKYLGLFKTVTDAYAAYVEEKRNNS